MGLGTRGCGAYSELSLFVVEVCKVNTGSVSIAQDSGGMVQGIGVDRDGTQRVGGGLHANLTLSLWMLDQTSVLVLSRIMVGKGKVGQEKTFGGDRAGD